MPIPIREWRSTPIIVDAPAYDLARRVIRQTHQEVQLEVILPNRVCDTLNSAATLEDLIVALLPHLERDQVQRILAAAAAQRLDS